MAFGTLVDSNVLLDVFTNDERWGDWSADHLANAFDAGPVAINPLIFAELTVGFDRIEDLDHALPDAIEREDLPWKAAFLAGRCSAIPPQRRDTSLTATRLLHRSSRGDERTCPVDP